MRGVRVLRARNVEPPDLLFDCLRVLEYTKIRTVLQSTIFPNVCLWRRSLCSDLVLTLKNCIEPPSFARTAYVVAIWSSFLFDFFVKIWATCKIIWANGLPPPLGKKFPVRLWPFVVPFCY